MPTWTDLRADWVNNETMDASDFNAYADRINAHSGVLDTHTTTLASHTSSLALMQPLSAKDQANGYAGLDSGGKLPLSSLPFTPMEYKGVWNASTNSPALADGTGTKGSMYRVGTGAVRNLGSGSIIFDVGDYVIYNASGVWEKSDTTDAVASVAGLTGTISSGSLKTALSLVASDVGLGNVDNTSDATKWAATATITNKNLTSGTNTFPTFNQNTTGSAATLTTARAFRTNLDSTSTASFNGSADVTPGVTGTLPVGNGGSGATTLTGLLVGNGTSAFTAVTAPSGAVVGTTDVQTLANKTLTSPKINAIQNSAGNTTISLGGSASAVNYVFAWAEATGGGPQLAAGGTDTNIDLMLYGKGTGVVKANGVEVVTLSGTHTLTNKTLTSPTINTPAIANATSLSVGTSTNSGTTTPKCVNLGGTYGTNTAGTAGNQKINLLNDGTNVWGIGVGNDRIEYQSGSGTSHRFYIGGVEALRIFGGSGTGLQAFGVDMVSTTAAQTLTNKTVTAPKVDDIYDTNGSRVLSIYPWGGTIANYLQVAGTPSGTAPTVKATGTDTNVHLNLLTKGTGVVKANGVEVVTVSGAQTLANKTLTTPTVTINDNALTVRSAGSPTQTAQFDLSDIWAGGPALMRLPMNSSYTSYLLGSSGTAPTTSSSSGVQRQVEFDSNYIYVCTATNTWKRAALSSF